MSTNQPPAEPVELLGYEAIAELTGISNRLLRVWKARGKMPAPDFIVLTGNPVPAWKRKTILDWQMGDGTVPKE